MDPELLARIQFAFTAGFHFLFPPLSIGLGVFLVVVQGFAYKLKTPEWRSLADYWTKIFALIFAFGVATGIVLEFEFGTNWARYSRFVGDVFGSPLAAEAIFALAQAAMVLPGSWRASAGSGSCPMPSSLNSFWRRSGFLLPISVPSCWRVKWKKPVGSWGIPMC